MALRTSRRRLRPDLTVMLWDGFAFSFMVGCGESYLAAFALALGRSDIVAGLITTVPMLAGAVLQLATPAAVGLLRSHKRWVVLCAGLQALSFVPLTAGALAGNMSALALYLAVTLYWGLGMATSPAWNTWAGTVVPRRLRPGYFAARARWQQVSLLLGLAVGGAILQAGERLGVSLYAYAAVFFLSLGARLLSTYALGRQSEPKPVPLGETRISPGIIRAHVAQGGHGRLLVYLLVFQSSVWIAAPYFTPYMLGNLGLDYLTFGVLTGIAFLSRIVVYPMLGRIARRSGTKRVLWLGSAAIIPLPALWLVSDSLAWLVCLQLLGGAAWAAFELATLLSFFEHIPEDGRTSVLSVYNLAYAAAVVVGSSVGGVILLLAGRGPEGYMLLFACSSLARIASVQLLRGVSDVRPSYAQVPPLRTLGLRPSTGAVQRPVLSALEEPGTDDGAP